MAGQLVTDITGMFVTNYPAVVEDAVSRKAPLLSLLQTAPIDSGGFAGPEWPVNYSGNASAGSYVPGDPEVAAGKQAYKEAKLTWKGSRVIVKLSSDIEDQATVNSHAVADLVARESVNAAEDLTRSEETQSYGDGTGNSSKDMDGIMSFGKATGSYAGLDMGTYTWWAGTTDASGGALALADMRAVLDTLAGKPNPVPCDLGICGATVFGFLRTLLDTKFTYDPLAWETLKGSSQYAGFQMLPFEGMTIVRIPGYTAQRIDFLVSSDIKLRTIRELTVKGPVDDADMWKWTITRRRNMVCRAPWRQGSMTGITS
jgi:hypothetical protein